MNFCVLLALILAVCCVSEATFFSLGGRHKKKNGLFGGYLADIGGAFLRYAPDFYDVIPKQVTKFLGGHKKHKHHNDYDDHHHHHHKKHHHHDDHTYGHYFDSAAYYGLSPYHSPYSYHYGVPHHGTFYPEFHDDFNDISQYGGLHSGYDFDNFHHFDHFY